MFSCFGIGGVRQNPGNEKGGISRPSKLKEVRKTSTTRREASADLRTEGSQHVEERIAF
jgi:hypothetical protein